MSEIAPRVGGLARESPAADLTPQLLGVVTALRPAGAEVRLVRREHRRARRWRGSLRACTGPRAATDRLAAQAGLPTDRSPGAALLVEGDDGLVASQPLRAPCLPVLPRLDAPR
ncbi:MAG: hypothetical protein IT307_11155 [Chloroflexi bacterium]|nr:hypothetical protein [Chloroflexota bacterium]